MRKTFCLAALLWLAPVAGAQESPRVVVISIDSLRPEFYNTSNFDTPTLHRLVKEGAAAEKMLSVFPSVTYVNHTTMVTGASPDRHGIVANTAFSRQTGQLPGWNFQAELIQVPALWNLARARGLHSAAFSWPVSVGAQIDWNIPECFHLKGVDNETTEALIRQNSTPGLFRELDAQLPRPFPQDFAQWDQWLPATFNFVWQQHHPDVAFVHVLNIDHTQHLFGPDSPETREAVHVVDDVIARLIANLDPATTTLFIVGDHGFLPVKTNVCPNRLFVDRGWITLNGDKVSSFRVIAQTNGGSAAIYCKDPALENEVLGLLKEKGRGVFSILGRDELDRRHSFPGALCAISAFRDYGFRGDSVKPFLEAAPRTVGQHGHVPELVPTGLIAWGRGVESGRHLGTIHITQLAPTVARLLDLPTDAMEGKPLKLSARPRPAESLDR